jgi:hypothetical protein
MPRKPQCRRRSSIAQITKYSRPDRSRVLTVTRTAQVNHTHREAIYQSQRCDATLRGCYINASAEKGDGPGPVKPQAKESV